MPLRADQKGGVFILNNSKMWIANRPDVSPRRISFFIKRNMRIFSIVYRLDKLRMR
jgi:hypothetical protein